jgi:hypothetical protein
MLPAVFAAKRGEISGRLTSSNNVMETMRRTAVALHVLSEVEGVWIAGLHVDCKCSAGAGSA